MLQLKSIDKILDSLNRTLLDDNGEQITAVGDSAYNLVAGSAEKLGHAKPYIPNMPIHI